MWLLVVFGKRLLSPGCVPDPTRSPHGGDRPPDRGKLWPKEEEIRRRVFAPPPACNIPTVRKKVEGLPGSLFTASQ